MSNNQPTTHGTGTPRINNTSSSGAISSHSSSTPSIPVNPIIPSNNSKMDDTHQPSIYTAANHEPKTPPGSLSSTSASVEKSLNLDNDPEFQPQEPMVGLREGIIFIMSLMIGSGIFSSIGDIHRNAGNIGLTLIIWVAVGLIALCGALGYAELGTAIPGSGGEMQYLEHGFGSWACFVFEWVSLLVIRPAGISTLMNACAKHAMMAWAVLRISLKPEDSNSNPAFYTKKLAERLEELGDQSAAIASAIAKYVEDDLTWYMAGLGCVITLLITALACLSYKASDRTQSILTYSKVVSLVVIIGVGLSYAAFSIHGILWKNLTIPGLFTHLPSLKIEEKTFYERVKGIFSCIGLGLWSFDGWNNLNAIAGRVKNPKTTLPRSLMISILTVLGLYLLTVLGYYSVVDSKILVDSETVGFNFGYELGKHVNENHGSKVGAVIMCLLVMASTFGASVSSVISFPDLVGECVKKGHLPAWVAKRSSFTGTMVLAYCFQSFMACIYLFAFGKYFSSLAFLASMPAWVAYASCMLILIMLRVKEPGLPRPYKCFILMPVIFFVACVMLIFVMCTEKPKECLISLGLCLLGVPVYFAFIKSRERKMARTVHLTGTIVVKDEDFTKLVQPVQEK